MFKKSRGLLVRDALTGEIHLHSVSKGNKISKKSIRLPEDGNYNHIKTTDAVLCLFSIHNIGKGKDMVSVREALIGQIHEKDCPDELVQISEALETGLMQEVANTWGEDDFKPQKKDWK